MTCASLRSCRSRVIISFALSFVVGTSAALGDDKPPVGASTSASAGAQDVAGTASLEDAFRQNSYAIELHDGMLSGPGAKFLEKSASKAQFVVVGEQHRAREIPEFTSALFSLLHQHFGFNHLALEQDPLSARLASMRPMNGRPDRITTYARRYPDAFTFNTDQELALIASARSKGVPGHVLWGLDQTFGAIHVLDRLVEIAPSRAVRERTARVAAEVRLLEVGRRQDSKSFMLPNVGKSSDFLALPNFYPHPSGSEPDFLITQLFTSLEIYRNWWLATTSNQPTRWAQSHDREENMKELFMAEYRAAQQAGEMLPKVVAKLGHYHAIRGENWSDLPSLGEFMAEFAKSNGMSSFHLAVWNNNDQPGDYQILAKDRDYGALFRSASARTWTVVDFVPLRGRAYAGQLAGVTPELRKVILGFDAALLIGSGTAGTYEWVGESAAPAK